MNNLVLEVENEPPYNHYHQDQLLERKEQTNHLVDPILEEENLEVGGKVVILSHVYLDKHLIGRHVDVKE